MKGQILDTKMNTSKISIMALAIALLVSCSGKDTDTASCLGNDCINRYYYVPYIVGSEMEFAYAMFMPKGTGRIDEAKVTCSIPGAEGTYLENNAYDTDEYGQDRPHRIGPPCTADNGCYIVKFEVDTVAATLRFHYVIPEEARGRNIRFHFDVKAGSQRASYDTPEYQVRKMDMKLDIAMTKSRCFFSMEDMAAYTAEEAESAGATIDFVWGYSTAFGANEDRSFFANAARLEKFSSFFSQTTPVVQLNDTRKMYRFTIIEPQLSRQEFDGFYIDDRDFETLKLDCDSDGLIGINNRNGFWMETSDGKYRAYVYCNAISAEACTISVKRYKLID